ncbi:hypothetical protein M2454_001042 [Aequitasia blattaphilus]|uniref:DUF6106 family protein n=1 Tax=Aequitasia blattaphilus TaxID=2949332 RepID=A0ABT1E940_9FIRM|nr:DUF6106 family protein [Aequitasia blattaphilus]MCP1102350.1 DUF6106 family protein [Aequitasia blattaphilus]MCR8614990.1 DUF6106 family protein [Aequitasia blattaphilus]
MNDAYYEQLVPAKARNKDRLIFVGLWIVAAVCLLGSMFSSIFLLLFLAAVIVNVILFMPRMQLEYEYVLVNSELEIDAIYKKSNRKKLFSMDIKDAEMIRPAKSSAVNTSQLTKLEDFSSREENLKKFIVLSKDQTGSKGIILSPDEKLLKQLKSYAGVRFQEF